MLFTREPIIETVITARTGFRLVVRNSKCPQEETLVDAIEIVSFGNALFYRCNERPKAFLVPVSDYEAYEVRETRLVLKHLSATEVKKIKEAPSSKVETSGVVASNEITADPSKEDPRQAAKNDNKRRERRRQRRRRDPKGANESSVEGGHDESGDLNQDDEITSSSLDVASSQAQPAPAAPVTNSRPSRGSKSAPMQLVSALIPPPSTLVSDDIFRYEQLGNDVARQGVQESEKKERAVTKARTDLMDALDYYNQEGPTLDIVKE